MSNIWQTVLAIIGSIGSAGVIIAAVVRFASNRIADKLSAKYQLKLDKSLETFRHHLDRKNYVSKVRFDTEFVLFRELTAACRSMVNDTYYVYPTYANVPANEDEREEYEKRVFEQATKSHADFVKKLNENAPFITKEIFNAFDQVCKLCKQNLDVYVCRWDKGYLGNWNNSQDKRDAERDAYKRTGEFTKKFDELIDMIRSYLAELDVKE